MMEKPNQRSTPEWLKRVQENSWEPEILLSGLVLIGLLQLPAMIRRASDFYRAETLSGNLLGVFTALEQIVYVLVFGLIVHLFLRSVWVGLIGLTYTFPKGIKPENLGYQKKFEDQVRQLPDTESQIILLEKVCSSIFATCFFLLMVIFGAVIGVSSLVIFLLILDSFLGLFGFRVFSSVDPYIDTFLSIVFLFFLLDFITIGLYRKNKYLVKAYYPIHRFMGWITLSKFYRGIYYTFASNIKKGYLIAFFVLFLVFVLFGQVRLQKRPDDRLASLLQLYSFGMEENFFSPYYADRNETWQSARLEIPKPTVTGRFLEVRTKSDLGWEKLILQACGIEVDTPIADRTVAEDANLLDCVNRVFKVSIDGSVIENPDWMYYFHQKDGRKGLISFLDVGELEPGKHKLTVYSLFEGKEVTFGSLYFFKE